ncbi:MAG: 2-amino-4-hydroxy-6-hydroxymethyldihydropteridine diphosphokinase [Gammaproteobacteria bacterium]|nr:2-amino-4-hydroxy-6-hydroxymethyldihydropteridine diphosphokinase [Gammaproteobacteria bacterium]
MPTTLQPWVAAWIGLGSNQDDPQAQIQRAIEALKQLPDTHCLRVSGLYANPPFGPIPQPDYVNAVVGLLTRLTPRVLLGALQQIELAAGRNRSDSQRWGPRPLDLDLLTYGVRQIAEHGLKVPHPGIAERNFVLLPLLEVAPSLQIPGLPSIAHMASSVGRSGILRLG